MLRELGDRIHIKEFDKGVAILLSINKSGHELVEIQDPGALRIYARLLLKEPGRLSQHPLFGPTMALTVVTRAAADAILHPAADETGLDAAGH